MLMHLFTRVQIDNCTSKRKSSVCCFVLKLKAGISNIQRRKNPVEEKFSGGHFQQRIFSAEDIFSGGSSRKEFLKRILSATLCNITQKEHIKMDNINKSLSCVL